MLHIIILEKTVLKHVMKVMKSLKREDKHINIWKTQLVNNPQDEDFPY